MKIGDLVKYRHSPGWIGIIVQVTPGTMKLKYIRWWHQEGGTDRGAYAEKDLEVISEAR